MPDSNQKIRIPIPHPGMRPIAYPDLHPGKIGRPLLAFQNGHRPLPNGWIQDGNVEALFPCQAVEAIRQKNLKFWVMAHLSVEGVHMPSMQLDRVDPTTPSEKRQAASPTPLMRLQLYGSPDPDVLSITLTGTYNKGDLPSRHGQIDEDSALHYIVDRLMSFFDPDGIVIGQEVTIWWGIDMAGEIVTDWSASKLRNAFLLPDRIRKLNKRNAQQAETRIRNLGLIEGFLLWLKGTYPKPTMHALPDPFPKGIKETWDRNVDHGSGHIEGYVQRCLSPAVATIVRRLARHQPKIGEQLKHIPINAAGTFLMGRGELHRRLGEDPTRAREDRGGRKRVRPPLPKHIAAGGSSHDAPQPRRLPRPIGPKKS